MSSERDALELVYDAAYRRGRADALEEAATLCHDARSKYISEGIADICTTVMVGTAATLRDDIRALKDAAP